MPVTLLCFFYAIQNQHSKNLRGQTKKKKKKKTTTTKKKRGRENISTQTHADLPKIASTISPDLVDNTDNRVSLNCYNVGQYTIGNKGKGQQAKGQHLHRGFLRSNLATILLTQEPPLPWRT